VRALTVRQPWASWLLLRRWRRTTPGTVTVTLTADTTAFVDAMHDAAETLARTRYRLRVAHEWSLGQAYVGVQLDEMCRDLGLDPVVAWRMPRAVEQRLAGLTDPDRVRRAAAEAAWLRSARAHQAHQATARREAGDA